MPSSTFKGLYPECNECVYQFYDNIKNKSNCSFSHNKIRSNANTTGIKYEIDFSRDTIKCLLLYKLRT